MNLNYLIILLCALRTCITNKDYKLKDNAKESSTRLLQLMRLYYEQGRKRIIDLNYIKFTYDQNKYFEQGYVLGEIIERFRKMVEHVKRPFEFKSDRVFDTLKRTELIQRLYFEIYHLVNMMHEIPRKYEADEQEEQKPEDFTLLFAAEKQHQLDMKKRQQDKKKRMKKLKKMRQLVLQGKISGLPTTKKSTRWWWPIEYGWEIDYYW